MAIRSTKLMTGDRITQAEALPGTPEKSGLTYKLDNLDVAYGADNEVLVVNWEGEISSKDIRIGYKIVLQQVEMHKPQKLLLDFHNRVSIKRRDQRWVFSTVFPSILRVVGNNVFVAIVLPVELYHGLVTDINGDELMQNNNFLIIHHSLYREEGFRWLESMRATGHKFE